MKRNCLILTGLIAGCVCLLQVGCQQQAGPVEKPETVLTVPKPAVAPKKALAPQITFENIVYDFGEVGPKTQKAGEFKFTNTGDGLLKITKVEACCGCFAKLEKKEYAPGESGTLKVECRWSQRSSTMMRHLYVNNNDKTKPRVVLTIKAKIASKVDYEPKTLNLSLGGENAGCLEITITSLDGKTFSIKAFKSTGDCITADVNSSAEATKFVLRPKVDVEKLRKGLNGFVEISLTHPELNKITISFNTLPELKINPPVIIVFNAEPQKPIRRDVWILNNYGEDFEIESTSSKNNVIKVLNQEKIHNGYHLEVEIIPPSIEGEQKVFTDVFSVNIKGGKKVEITCRGFYTHGLGPSSH